jgi:hypothetical protein
MTNLIVDGNKAKEKIYDPDDCGNKRTKSHVACCTITEPSPSTRDSYRVLA